jgi:alkylation response protein AidB-like acyl-CoA dehydrogenase
LDFEDSKEERLFREQARNWLDRNIPHDLDLDRCDHNSDLDPYREWQQRKMADRWSCITWPEALGGRGGEAIHQVIWSQEEGPYTKLNTPFIIGQGMAGATLMMHATQELQQRFLGPMASGEEIWCQLFSEPGAGSDLAGIRTRAVRDGDDWIINGQKVWTSYAQLADYGILLARTDPSAPKHHGLTYFILDMNAPGVEVRPIRMLSGESDFNEVFFDNVRIPDARRVGDIGMGWRVALTTLMNERLTVGTHYPSLFEEFLELSCATCNEAGALADQADVQDHLADWFIQSNGLKYTGFRMISALSRGETPGPESSVSKLIMGRGMQKMARQAIDMLDQAGLIVDPDKTPLTARLQHVYFLAIGGRIAGGTDEILLNILGERVLGLAPEPRIDKELPFDQLDA